MTTLFKRYLLSVGFKQLPQNHETQRSVLLEDYNFSSKSGLKEVISHFNNSFSDLKGVCFLIIKNQEQYNIHFVIVKGYGGENLYNNLHVYNTPALDANHFEDIPF